MKDANEHLLANWHWQLKQLATVCQDTFYDCCANARHWAWGLTGGLVRPEVSAPCQPTCATAVVDGIIVVVPHHRQDRAECALRHLTRFGWPRKKIAVVWYGAPRDRAAAEAAWTAVLRRVHREMHQRQWAIAFTMDTEVRLNASVSDFVDALSKIHAYSVCRVAFAARGFFLPFASATQPPHALGTTPAYASTGLAQRAAEPSTDLIEAPQLPSTVPLQWKRLAAWDYFLQTHREIDFSMKPNAP